jgi:hypothetical protein
MFTVVYRWRLRPGMDAQFIRGWERVTRAIHAKCGSYGSRLHRCADGTWMAYARWPDSTTRAACDHGDQEGARLMQAAIAERYDEITCDIISDLLHEPQTEE